MSDFTDDDPRHGTYAGWNAHRAHGTKACPPCREAARQYARARRLRLASQRRFIFPLETRATLADFNGVGASIARGLRESA